MQVTVEKKEGIVCDLVIEVPFAEVDCEVNSRLQKIAKTAKIDGFRPGKVPVSFVKKRYGEDVRYEVISDLLPKKYVQAIQDEKLNAAGVEVDINNNREGEDLKFTAHVELFPEVSVSGLENITVEKPVASVTDVELDKMIENLRKQSADWVDMDRVAAIDDKVNIDFSGKQDGKEFAGGSAESHELILGSGQMIPGFENGIVGMSLNEVKSIDVTFPEDYQSEDLAGKDVTFDITLNGVKEPVLPEVNEDFAKKFGVKGDVESFYSEIRGNMERELKAATKKLVKEQVFEGLKKENDFDVPKSLVASEIKRSKEDLLNRMGGDAAKMKLEDIPDNLFEEPSIARVKLGLIMRAIVENNKLEATEEKVNLMVDDLVSVYDDETEARNHYLKSEKELENIKGAVVEDELVNFVLSSAQVTEKEVDFFDLIKKASANSQM
jgi:trigger factor